MKKYLTLVAQGDVIFEHVQDVPKSAVKANSKVVAHSETGHHHVLELLEGTRAELFETDNPLIAYLAIDDGGRGGGGGVEIHHQRPWDTHAMVTLGGGVWCVRRQREFVPDGWRRVQD